MLRERDYKRKIRITVIIKRVVLSPCGLHNNFKLISGGHLYSPLGQATDFALVSDHKEGAIGGPRSQRIQGE